MAIDLYIKINFDNFTISWYQNRSLHIFMERPPRRGKDPTLIQNKIQGMETNIYHVNLKPLLHYASGLRFGKTRVKLHETRAKREPPTFQNARPSSR